MIDLKGTLQSIQLEPLVGFLRQLRKTGSLSISARSFNGSVFLEGGRVVGAVFGSERGLAAFEAIVLALGDGDFEFAENAPERELNFMVEPDVLDGHLRRLASERLEFSGRLPSLAVVPSVDLAGSDTEQLAIDRGSLRLLFDMDGRRSVLELARGRGLMATARRVAALAELGVVRVTPAGDGVAVERSLKAPPERSG
ncbi:MAG: DUF4388 domain-containing protein [Chloroflexota bacterium]